MIYSPIFYTGNKTKLIKKGLIDLFPKNINKFEKIMMSVPRMQMGKVNKNGKFEIIDTAKKKVITTDVKKLARAYHDFSNKMSQ